MMRLNLLVVPPSWHTRLATRWRRTRLGLLIATMAERLTPSSSAPAAPAEGISIAELLLEASLPGAKATIWFNRLLLSAIEKGAGQLCLWDGDDASRASVVVKGQERALDLQDLESDPVVAGSGPPDWVFARSIGTKILEAAAIDTTVHGYPATGSFLLELAAGCVHIDVRVEQEDETARFEMTFGELQPREANES